MRTHRERWGEHSDGTEHVGSVMGGRALSQHCSSCLPQQNQVATVQQSTSNKHRSQYKPRYNSACLFLGFCYFPFTSCPWYKSSQTPPTAFLSNILFVLQCFTQVLCFPSCVTSVEHDERSIHKNCHRLSYRKSNSLVTHTHTFSLPSLTHMFFLFQMSFILIVIIFLVGNESRSLSCCKTVLCP